MNKVYYIIQRLDGQYRTMEYNANTYTLIMGWTPDINKAKHFDRHIDAWAHKNSLPISTYWIRTIIVE